MVYGTNLLVVAREEITAIVKALEAWAASRTSPPEFTVGAAETQLTFLRDHVGVDDFAILTPEDLYELLLEVYPREMSVDELGGALDVVPTLREVLTFLSETERIQPSALPNLRRTVDVIEPIFLGEMGEPEELDTPQALVQAMIADGVDVSDEGEVSRWVEEHMDQFPPGSYDAIFDLDDVDGLFDDGLFDDGFIDGIDAKELLGLPDQVPPMRLPSDAELADAARGSALIEKAKRLALWAGEHARITESGDLAPADAAAVARELGLAVPPGEVREMTDLPELWHLWLLADDLEFFDLTGDSVVLGADAQDWPGDSDDEVLDVWQHALADTMFFALPRAADLADRDDLNFEGVGASVVLLLFLSRGEGVPLAELSDVVREPATAELSAGKARKAWSSWVDQLGDPAEELCRRLSELGAVTVDDGVARLTPLALDAMRPQLLDSGVDVPLLPPIEDMSASDLVEFGKEALGDDLATESAAWLALRSPEESTRELLAIAAAGGAAERVIATSIAAKVSEGVRSLWQDALEDPGLRPYAKMTLTALGGAKRDDVRPTIRDFAWLLTDSLATMADELTPEEVAEELSEAVPAGQEQQMFDVIWRSDHPQAHDVLTTLGKKHPDKKIAKAARKAAFKVVPRSTGG